METDDVREIVLHSIYNPYKFNWKILKTLQIFNSKADMLYTYSCMTNGNKRSKILIPNSCMYMIIFFIRVNINLLLTV